MGTPLTEPQASAGGGTNCDSNHIANLDNPNHGLIHDLNANTVPQFSWITPNNCSDAHDTTCKGNNLSGAFGLNADGPGQPERPDLQPGRLPAFDPEATTPRNYTGGLYASDLFLAYYVPLIEESSAYADGGLIDITFDEGEPSFTYSGNSFNNVLTNSSVVSGSPAMPAGQGTSSPQGSAPADAPSYGTPGSTAPGADSISVPTALPATPPARTSAAPTSTSSRPARTRRCRPTAPAISSTRVRETTRRGPPPACTQTTPTLVPADCVPGIVRGDSGNSSRCPHRHRDRWQRNEHHHLPHAHQRQPGPGR